MLFGRVFVLVFTYAIVQIECNSTQWANEYQLPYQLNFTDNRRFEIGSMIIIYVQPQEHGAIDLRDENDDINLRISIRYRGILLNSRFQRVWNQNIYICGGDEYFECTNHNDISEVIIARVEGGYNVFMNGKRRNPNVYPSKDGTEATSLWVLSEVGSNFEVTGITALLPDPP
uniref:Galectin domain-containing protein n=1 Tax=Bursaphelenchus xylophilus TaxID=6326 RepID=A0A1I7RUD5_BURXY